MSRFERNGMIGVLVGLLSLGGLGACAGGNADDADAGTDGTDAGASDGGAMDRRGPDTADAVAVGPCQGEQFTRGYSSQELYCHKIDVPPTGVFYAEEFCFTFNADGTGKTDSAGGYDEAIRLTTSSYVRTNDIKEFQWGALIDKNGTFKRVGADNALQIFWRRRGSDTPVDYQLPLLYWDDSKRAFVMVHPPIVSALPANATNGACMFGPPSCVKTSTREACWAGGYLDGSYKELSGGKVLIEGQYTKGVRTGTWKTYSYSYTGETLTRTERDYLPGGTEKDYRERNYGRSSLESEGDVRNDLRQGRWKFYFVADDPNTSPSQRVNAAGLVQKEGSYDKGTEVGIWIVYYIRYDIEAPARTDYPTYSAFQVAETEYYMRRKGVDICKSNESDRARNWNKWYIYGRSFCPSRICNAGLTEIFVIDNGQKSCFDASEVPKMCPTSGATCA